MAPHRYEDNGGVPFAFGHALNGYVCFNGVENGLEVPKDSHREPVSESDCLGESVPLVGGTDQVAARDGRAVSPESVLLPSYSA